jgi:hypothetical protein
MHIYYSLPRDERFSAFYFSRSEAQFWEIETHFKQGQELLEQGLPEESVCIFEDLVSKDMMFASAWEGLADAHGRLNHKEK